MFEIKTTRIILRDMAPSDLAAMHRLRTRPEVTEHFDVLHSSSLMETQRWVQSNIHHNGCKPRLSFNLTMVRLSYGQILGWIGIGPKGEGSEDVLDFGFAVLPEYWNQGFATEALRAVIGFAFQHLGAQGVFGECDGDNRASARVMEKAGLRRLDFPGKDLCFLIENPKAG